MHTFYSNGDGTFSVGFHKAALDHPGDVGYIHIGTAQSSIIAARMVNYLNGGDGNVDSAVELFALSADVVVQIKPPR